MQKIVSDNISQIIQNAQVYLKGIGPWQSILLGSAALIPLYLSYMGIFKSITFKKTTFKSKLFVYKDIQSRMMDLGKEFGKVEKNMNHQFKNEFGAGIYHDDPKQVKNEADCRISIGFFVEKDEISTSEQFLKDFPEYKKKIVEFKGYQTSFPCRNFFSFIIGPMKVYPSFGKLQKKENLKTEHMNPPIEYYYKDRIEFYFPYGEGQEKCTDISSISTPEYKQ